MIRVCNRTESTHLRRENAHSADRQTTAARKTRPHSDVRTRVASALLAPHADPALRQHTAGTLAPSLEATSLVAHHSPSRGARVRTLHAAVR